MPEALQRASFPDSGVVNAYITVDRASGGARQSMDISNGQASFSDDIADGSHSFLLEMDFVDSKTINLIKAEKTVTVSSSSSTSISFTEKDFTYTNSDNDFYTNVREIEAGSDPFSSDSVPSSGDDNYEDNDTYPKAYDITALEGVLVNNKWTTSYGILTPSDNIDLFKIVNGTHKRLIAEVWIDPGVTSGFRVLSEDGTTEKKVGIASNIQELENDITSATLTVDSAENRNYYLVFFSETSASGTYAMRWRWDDG
jgi:hypothetical protein